MVHLCVHVTLEVEQSGFSRHFGQVSLAFKSHLKVPKLGAVCK